MGTVNYVELDWREAMVLGTALQEGLLDVIATEPGTSSAVARGLGRDERAVHAILAALA